MEKPILDFTVLAGTNYVNTTTLYIADNSYWLHIEDKPAIIEITTPGSKKPAVNYWDKNKINNFNSLNLFLNCPNCNSLDLEELPDGIYDITLKGSPDNFNINKKHLRTTLIRIRLAKQLVSLNLGCAPDEEYKAALDKILKVSTLLMSAEANVELGNIIDGKREFDLANRLLEKIENCSSCKP